MNITIDDERNCYDLHTNIGRYQYLASRLGKYGAGSDELSLLERLYKEAECSPEIVQGELEKRARAAKSPEIAIDIVVQIVNRYIRKYADVIRKTLDKANKENRPLTEDEQWFMDIELCKRVDVERITREIQALK